MQHLFEKVAVLGPRGHGERVARLVRVEQRAHVAVAQVHDELFGRRLYKDLPGGIRRQLENVALAKTVVDELRHRARAVHRGEIVRQRHLERPLEIRHETVHTPQNRRRICHPAQAEMIVEEFDELTPVAVENILVHLARPHEFPVRLLQLLRHDDADVRHELPGAEAR